MLNESKSKRTFFTSAYLPTRYRAPPDLSRRCGRESYELSSARASAKVIARTFAGAR